jgi:signal transduction histidine kinase
MKSWQRHLRFGLYAVLWLALFRAMLLPLQAVEEMPGSNSLTMDDPKLYVSPTNGLGSWIWTSNTLDNQTCFFWKTFEIPEQGSVTNARLVMTADNEFTLYLDGRELGRGAEWRELFIFDLTQLLTPGRHVLAVDCYNGSFFAGMLFGLQISLADGRQVEVESDSSWRIVSEAASGWKTRTEADPRWPAATIIADLGGAPWWTKPTAVNIMPPLRPIKIYLWQTGWFQITLLVVCGLVILISLRLMAQLASHRKERRLLQQERARIAREIHDDIGSRMTQLVLNGEVAQSGLSEGSETQVQLVQICDEARQLLRSMDEILWAVNPQRDTLRDFEAYVCNYAQEFLKPTQIQCLFEVDSEMSAAAFELPLRRSLLLAIKETLTNAVKHSAATELCLQIRRQRHQLVVVVRDNGRGFDSQKVKSARNGLNNMTQRMTELGGHCEIASQPGKGCRVEFSIPLEQPPKGLWAKFWHTAALPEPADDHRNRRSNEPA